MNEQRQPPVMPVNLAPLIIRFEMAIERLGKASRFQFGNVVCWEIYSPNLLSGMRKAAEMSLKQEGFKDPELEISCALEVCPSNPFLALRGLLGAQMLSNLVERFEKELEATP